MLSGNLRQVGGSVMIALPPTLLEMLDMKVGSAVSLSVQSGSLVIKPKRRKKYTLADLIAKCDPTVPFSKEDKEWFASPPVGKELI